MKLIIGSQVTLTQNIPYISDEEDIKYHDLWARLGIDVNLAIGSQSLSEGLTVTVKRFKRGGYTTCALVECNNKEYWVVKKDLELNSK